MTQVRARLAQTEVFALSRVFIKASGITVWNVRSEHSGHDYHVTWLNGRVSSCERADGTPCPGWRYNRKCHHAALVVAREDERRNFSACRGCDQCRAQEQEARDERRTRQNNFALAMGF